MLENVSKKFETARNGLDNVIEIRRSLSRTENLGKENENSRLESEVFHSSIIITYRVRVFLFLNLIRSSNDCHFSTHNWFLSLVSTIITHMFRVCPT